MPAYLIVPAIAMTLAFAFYSAGVWTERLTRDLRVWHVALFWVGLGLDAYGTYLMNLLVASGREPDPIHGVTGAAAFWLMALHAAWATWVVARGSERMRATFHRYSLAVWLVWLVPYLGGMIAGMAASRS